MAFALNGQKQEMGKFQCVKSYMAFALSERTVRNVYHPRVSLLRRSTLGYWLLPLRGDLLPLK